MKNKLTYCLVIPCMYTLIFSTFLAYKPSSTWADHKWKCHGTYPNPAHPPLSQAHSLKKTGKQEGF